MKSDQASFDEIIDRRGTGCDKWDEMPRKLGVSKDDGIPMWVADMDFRPPEAVNDALRALMAHGIYGYHGDESSYLDAIRWWMSERHDWEVAREHIFTAHGLVNGTALCVDAFTDPGDGIVLLTPIYHAFFRILNAADREIVECPMPIRDGRYVLDFDAMDARMTGREKMLIFCSPHNPAGRVWTREELEGVAEFARRHDLILVSDEIHHDLVMPGHRHIPFAHLDDISDRLIMLTAATKTFNLAGAHTGNVIIADPDLRARFAKRKKALAISAGLFGIRVVEAAYSPEGAEWVDRLQVYLDGNRRLFEEGLNALPGIQVMPLEATYLAWADFSGTGMTSEEVRNRVYGEARLAPSAGETFGTGGEGFLRFNIATQRSRIREAVARLGAAFGDLQ
ncbi:MAG: PatB family C-S lyase [Pseudomonadota bacterium]